MRASLVFVSAITYCSAFVIWESSNHQTSINQSPADVDLDQRCGLEFGGKICQQGQCCSAAGWCGSSSEYCSVPQNCQENFGFCDSKIKPVGPDMKNIEGRPSSSHVRVNQCIVPKTLALTYDDGPSEHTDNVLDVLERHEAHGTFFLGGVLNGRGAIDTAWNKTVSRMSTGNHQIGSHTWSHPNLDTLTSTHRKEQMYKNEDAIFNVVGSFPTFMRAPMIICGKACEKDIFELGYIIVDWEFDSRDWMDPRPSVDQEVGELSDSMDQVAPDENMFVIQHDIHSSAAAVTDAILTHMKQTKPDWRAVTLVECLGFPLEASRWTPKDDLRIQTIGDGKGDTSTNEHVHGYLSVSAGTHLRSRAAVLGLMIAAVMLLLW